MKKHLGLINVVAAVVFIVIFNLCFYSGWAWYQLAGLGWSVFVVLVHLVLFFTNWWRSDNANKKIALAASLTTCVLGGILSIHDTAGINLLVVFACIYGTWLTLFLYKKPREQEITLMTLLTFPFLMIHALLGRFFSRTPQIGNQISKMKGEVDQKLMKAIGKGVLIGGALLVVLTGILTSADPIFARYLSNGDWISRAVISLVLLLLVICSYSLLLRKSEPKAKDDHYNELTKSIAVGAVALLFAVFLLVQVKYIFWQEVDEHVLTTQLDLSFRTYSEYLRQGFAQLLFASFIVICTMIWVNNQEKIDGKIQKLLRILNTVLIVETLVLIASAVKRLYLVYNDHGATITRVLGVVCVLWLVGWLIALLIQNYRYHLNSVMAKAVLVWSIVLLLAVSIINPAHLIAKYYRPTVNDTTDWRHLVYGLSGDSAAFIPDYLTHMENELLKYSSASASAWCDMDRSEIHVWESFENGVGSMQADKTWQNLSLTESWAVQKYLSNEQRERLQSITDRVAELDKVNCMVFTKPE